MAVAISHRNVLESKVQQSGAGSRLNHTFDNICGEIEILSVICTIVQPHHRLENGRAGKARPVSGFPEFNPTLSVRPQFCDNIIAKTATCRNCLGSLLPRIDRLLTGHIVIIVNKPKHGILHAPHIPSFATAQFIRVIPYVTALLLACQNAIDTAIHKLAQFPGAGIYEIRHSRMHVFAPKLRLPTFRALRLLGKGSGYVVNVSLDYLVVYHSVKSIAYIAFEMYIADIRQRPCNHGMPRKKKHCTISFFHCIPFV